MTNRCGRGGVLGRKGSMRSLRRNGFRFDHYTIERLFGWCGNFLRFTAEAMGIWTNSTSIQPAIPRGIGI